MPIVHSSNRSASAEDRLSFARLIAVLVLVRARFRLACVHARARSKAISRAARRQDARPDAGGPALPASPTTASRFRPRPAPTASSAASRCARSEGVGGSDWAVFALANNGDEQIDRLLVAPHFRLAGSGLFWPDLGASRIANITPSQGFAPDRQPSQEADVFRITLDPGAVVTFVAELRTPDLPQLYLWDADAYKDAVNSYTLYRGIVLGISGPAGAVPDHRVRGQGHGDVPGDGGARLGGADLSLHRFRLLEPGHRHRARRRPDVARRRRGVPRRVAGHLHLHLPQPQPLARPLQPPHHRLADRPRAPARRRGHRAVGRRGHRALLDRPDRRSSASR